MSHHHPCRQPVPQSPVFLNPGDFWFGPSPARIATLLGSCVAIVVWHPERREGGMCHYLLPKAMSERTDGRNDGRYAEGAFKLFLAELKRRHILPEACCVKMFGGASMLISEGDDIRTGSIASRNISVGKQLVCDLGFSLCAEHVGGTLSRKIIFNVDTGEVLLKLIGQQQTCSDSP